MMEAVPGKMQEVMDPGLFAAKLKEYATTDDAEVQSLFKQVEGGDLDAFRKLQQTIADKELGGCAYTYTPHCRDVVMLRVAYTSLALCWCRLQ